MGFKIDLVAVRGLPPQDVHTQLHLFTNGATETEPESDVVAAELPTAWYLLYFNDRSPPDEEKLLALSANAEVLFLSVSETVMTSCAKYWQNGESHWTIDHDCDVDAEHLHTTGTLPDCFNSIAQRLNSLQRENDDADYIFDIPVDVFSHITGFRYDGDFDGYINSFTVLNRLQLNRKWWKLW